MPSTQLSRWRGRRFACYTPPVMPQRGVLIHLISLSPYFCNSREFCGLQAKVDSIPIAPFLTQAPAASFKRLYRKRARAPCAGYPPRRKRTSDRALAFLRTWREPRIADHVWSVRELLEP